MSIELPSEIFSVLEQTDMPQKQRNSVISLFCGAGGLDVGFKQAGFDVAFAVDYEKAAVDTHNFNFSSDSAAQIDLLKTSPDQFLELVKEKCRDTRPIGIIGGPPCQGFSRANTQRSSCDPRNELANRYAKLVNALCRVYPIRFFLFENVPEILANKNAEFLASLKRRLNQKFIVSTTTINAADFGVPQTRIRFFMAGIRRDDDAKAFGFPKGHCARVTVKQAIGHLPEATLFNKKLTPEDIPHHPNHWTMRPKSVRFQNQTASTARPGRCFIKLDWEKPSRTVAYGHREIHIHPEGHRRLSIYEAMLLQGFPVDYQLVGNLSQQVTQVSNAVPPPVANALAQKLVIHLGLSHVSQNLTTSEYAR
ncbi:DNA cytosine methyltransferase [Achromobacter aegrifaciens]|uniref:DNA (cytosine-5-)-methyltransferase n=1 Tax=Achromobacter aegrifaciens TaxID=1287736 RepID=A0AAD2J223_ACHAE|nr:DNA cytosine methyltransferase [Achromobacter aegrifaciens]CUJ42663.1 Modification methylase HaeIII [Achromobacter aegrifaciens]